MPASAIAYALLDFFNIWRHFYFITNSLKLYYPNVGNKTEGVSENYTYTYPYSGL